jgi:hypothetical protein
MLPGLRADGTGTAYCDASTGTLDWGLFDPELLEHNVALREFESDVPLHLDRCGLCEDCAEYLEEHRQHARCDVPSPALAQFLRHAEKFGAECVLEAAGSPTAGELVELEAELVLLEHRKGKKGKPANRNGRPARTRQRRTTAELREHVVALRTRGMVPTAIADALNLSDRRVQAILAESRRSRNRAHKRLNHAKKYAAKGIGRPAARIGRQAAPEPLAHLGEQERG